MKGFKAKLAIGFILLTATTSAWAKGPIKMEVLALTEISFDGQKLDFGYSVGGGCQPHTSEVEVTIVPTVTSTPSFVEHDAIVKIYDVTPDFDYCEAMLYRTESVNLKQLIQQKAKAMGVQAYQINAILPKAAVEL
jgi:hypothetical protein